MKRAVIGVLLVLVLLFTAASPVFALAGGTDARTVSASEEADAPENAENSFPFENDISHHGQHCRRQPAPVSVPERHAQIMKGQIPRLRQDGPYAEHRQKNGADGPEDFLLSFRHVLLLPRTARASLRLTLS